MKSSQNFLAEAGVLTAGTGVEMTGVCTALTHEHLRHEVRKGVWGHPSQKV